jgi:tRNA(Arg) A34 adenosine deaminase TadA
VFSEKEAVEAKVEAYLAAAVGASPPGSDDYYARIALGEALTASREGNYGIGAVGVEVAGSVVREFRARSAMVTGPGVVDHAETRALLAHRSGSSPSATYPLDPSWPLAAGPSGLSVYGTLEPCPMCACTMTNAGAIRSVSTCRDGALVEDGGLLTSDGAACVLGDKYTLQPRKWRAIQRGLTLRFELLATTDDELRSLSWEIFAVTADEIDAYLARRRRS